MGKKIRLTVKCLMVLGVCACLIAAAYILISCYDRNGGFYLLQYATVNGGVSNPYLPAEWEVKGNDVYYSIHLAIYLLLGALGCFLWGVPLCWFGSMFQRVEQIQMELDGIKKEQGADISVLLQSHSPAEIVQMGYAPELEDYLHANHETISNKQAKEIMKALKMIP